MTILLKRLFMMQFFVNLIFKPGHEKSKPIFGSVAMYDVSVDSQVTTQSSNSAISSKFFWNYGKQSSAGLLGC